MKMPFILIVITFILFSCRSFPKQYQAVNGQQINSTDANCIGLFNDIKQQWAVYKKDSLEPNYYYYNEKLAENILSNRHSFIGVKISDLINFFGEPTKIDTVAGNYNYLISKKIPKNLMHLNDDHYWLMFVGKDTISNIVLYQVSTIY